jgi:GTP cyclohydrolase-4
MDSPRAEISTLWMRPMSTQTEIIDVQSQRPAVQLSLSRVGVTGVEKVIRIKQNGSEQLFSARFECVVDLGPSQKGAHMSRFEEVVNEAINQVVLGESTFKAEQLAEHIAQLVRERQDARRAEVSIEARFPEHKPAPISGIQTQELYTLHGAALASAKGTRRLIGVTAQGMTACPCAQELVADKARTRLTEDGFDAATLLEIVEQSMSSEIYELMKRSDEGHVVEKAHRRPRFVEDCVREMINGAVNAFPDLDDRAFIEANQVNLETIHQHNVVAERFGTLGEIRRELASGEPSVAHTTRRAWLDTSAGA